MKVFAISGSTRSDSSNLRLLKAIRKLFIHELEIDIYEELAMLPHFNPDLDKEDPPAIVKELRKKIELADGVLICTPEYVMSLPGALKNAIEWTVSTTVFSEKPVALITASGLGAKAHESLQLIMRTIYAQISQETQLLIQGARNLVNDQHIIINQTTLTQISQLMEAFIHMMKMKQSRFAAPDSKTL